MREMLGLVPGFFETLPGPLLDSERESFRSIELSDQTAIPNKYKELIGIAVSGATRCRYCVCFHTEAARLLGATDEEINEAALMARHAMGWNTYLNAGPYDYDRFTGEVNKIAAHIRDRVAAPAQANAGPGESPGGPFGGPDALSRRAAAERSSGNSPGLENRPAWGAPVSPTPRSASARWPRPP